MRQKGDDTFIDLFLTETQISADQDIAYIQYHLKDFNFILIDELDRFQSIGVFHKIIHVIDYASSTGVY